MCENTLRKKIAATVGVQCLTYSACTCRACGCKTLERKEGTKGGKEVGREGGKEDRTTEAREGRKDEKTRRRQAERGKKEERRERKKNWDIRSAMTKDKKEKKEKNGKNQKQWNMDRTKKVKQTENEMVTNRKKKHKQKYGDDTFEDIVPALKPKKQSRGH